MSTSAHDGMNDGLALGEWSRRATRSARLEHASRAAQRAATLDADDAAHVRWDNEGGQTRLGEHWSRARPTSEADFADLARLHHELRRRTR